MDFAVRILTWLFLAGLAGSAVVAILFILDLARLVFFGHNQDDHSKPVVG